MDSLYYKKNSFTLGVSPRKQLQKPVESLFHRQEKASGMFFFLSLSFFFCIFHSHNYFVLTISLGIFLSFFLPLLLFLSLSVSFSVSLSVSLCLSFFLSSFFLTKRKGNLNYEQEILWYHHTNIFWTN